MRCSSIAGPGLAAIALVGAALLAAPGADAITYGEQDCSDFSNDATCHHPNTVSLSGFRAPTDAEKLNGTTSDISSIRCSGSLLSNSADRFEILTAGHCASAYLVGLQDGSLVDVGVSFDPKIDRDLPQISPTAWSPTQYILGGQPVLARDYGPQGANASNVQFDYAVIVFELPPADRRTEGGQLVDLTNIAPVTLPDQDYLLGKLSAKDPLLLTAVGYGTGEAHAIPGTGGNQGGAVNSTEEFGQRWMTALTSAFHFMGPEKNLLFGSQNPARGFEGTCGGDSGGPMFEEVDGGEIQVAITSSGDARCRASSIMARTDGARAVEFLACVNDPLKDLGQIEECGCTEVDNQGECPDIN
jgi:hypothetical protein